MGLVIPQEQIQAIDEIGAVDGIAADAHDRALAEARRGGLGRRLVAQGSGARDDADASCLVDVSRHDSHLASARCDDSWAIWTDDPRAAAGDLPFHPRHILHGNAVGDADHQLDAAVDGFQDGVHGIGGRNIDRARRGTRGGAATVSKTGRPRWLLPPRPGVTPPTIFVP